MSERFECQQCGSSSDYPLSFERQTGVCVRCHDVENGTQPVFYSED